MAKIKITTDQSVLAELRRSLKLAQDEFLRLKMSGTASADALQKASIKIMQLGQSLRNAKQEVNSLANAGKSLSVFQKLEIGENISSIFRGLKEGVSTVRDFGNQIGTFITAANDLENSNRKLSAASKLTGTSFDFLKQTSKDVSSNLGLATKEANEFTVTLTKLGTKAGDTTKVSQSIQSLLDLGAAQGLNTTETLTAIQQAILGIDEGTDKLFQKNPSAIYDAFAKSIGTTAGKLNDQQKAQALLNEVVGQGGKVQGEYNRYLDTFAGKQQLLSQKVEVLKQEFGNLIQSGLTPFIDKILESDKGTQTFAGGVVVAGGALSTLIPLIGSTRLAFSGLNVTMKGTLAFAGKLGIVIAALVAASEITDLINENAKQMTKIEPGTSDTLQGKDGSIDNYLKQKDKQLKKGQFFTDEEIKRTKKETEELKKKSNELDNITDKLKNLGGTSSKSALDFLRASEITNDLIEAQKALNELLEKEITFTSDQKKQKVYMDYLKEVEVLRKKIASLQLPSDLFNFSTDGIKLEERRFGLISKEESDRIRDVAKLDIASQAGDEDQQSLLETSNEVYSNISNILTALNIGTETFIGKLLTFFNSAFSVAEGVGGLLSLLGLIPGGGFLASLFGRAGQTRAEGGLVTSGTPYLVGERGAELFLPNQSGYIMNNLDTMKLINQARANFSSGNVNVYVNAELDGLKFLKKNMPAYINYKGFKKL